MRVGRIGTVSLMLASGVARAAATGSMQAAFDAATAELDAGRSAAAKAQFTALEARILAAAKPSPHSLAAARFGLGQALAREGDSAGAVAALSLAVPGLTLPAEARVRRDALIELGGLEELELDLPPAQSHYREALALMPADAGNDRFFTRMRIARATMFDDPSRAVDELRDATPDADATFAKDAGSRARWWSVYGRALMNAQRYREARAALDKALRYTGGLTLMVGQQTMIVRNDAALAAKLGGDLDKAIELTAYTGAGRISGAALTRPADGQPPACGGPGGIRPDDVAVVEFGIAPDGSVAVAEPIYASRPGPMAIEFARSVRGWRWTPEAARAVSPLFRNAARIEMRCTTRAERRSTLGLLTSAVAFGELADGSPTVDSQIEGSRTSVEQLRAAVAKAEANGHADLALLPPLTRLAGSRLIDRVEAQKAWARAVAVARAGSAPPSTIAVLSIARILSDPELDYKKRRANMQSGLAALASDPLIAGDARTLAGTRLVTADVTDSKETAATTMALLRQVVDLPAVTLATDDPIRRAAAVRLASLEAAGGDRAAAEATFKTSGLAPEQCALLDSTPVPFRIAASSADYPDALLRLGFEGWAVTEFDVLADGRTQSQRTVIAYPAFLFGDASTRILRRTTFRPTFRPDGALSCGGYQYPVQYRVPNASNYDRAKPGRRKS